MKYLENYEQSYTNPFPGYEDKERAKYLRAMLHELDRRKALQQDQI